MGTTQSTGNDFYVANGFSGAFTMAQAGQTLTLNGNSNTNIAVGGPLTFGGAGTITVNEVIENNTGAGTLTLTGSSGYTGLTTVSTGTLSLTGSGALASAVDLPASDAVLDIAGASGNRTIGGLSGAAGSQVLLGSNTLTVAGIGPSPTFAGVISGAGGFTLAADGGLFAFSTQQAFTGPARVEAGTLEIAAGDDTLSSASSIVVGLATGPAASIDATGAGLRVFDTQTLGGYGAVRGTVAFLDGSTLPPAAASARSPTTARRPGTRPSPTSSRSTTPAARPACRRAAGISTTSPARSRWPPAPRSPTRS